MHAELRTGTRCVANAPSTQIRHHHRTANSRRVDDLTAAAVACYHARHGCLPGLLLLPLVLDALLCNSLLGNLRRRGDSTRDQLRIFELSVRHHSHVRQNLLGNLTEDWRSHITTVISAAGFV